MNTDVPACVGAQSVGRVDVMWVLLRLHPGILSVCSPCSLSLTHTHLVGSGFAGLPLLLNLLPTSHPLTPAGLEPAIFGSEDQRLIR